MRPIEADSSILGSTSSEEQTSRNSQVQSELSLLEAQINAIDSNLNKLNVRLSNILREKVPSTQIMSDAAKASVNDKGNGLVPLAQRILKSRTMLGILNTKIKEMIEAAEN